MRNRVLVPCALLAILVSIQPLGREVETALAKPPSQNRLVGIESSGTATCGALFAVDFTGNLYMDCGITGHFTLVGQVPGTPVSIARDINTSVLRIGTENGDIYAVNPVSLSGPPFTAVLVGNVFAP